MDFAAADPHWTSRGGFPGVKFLIGARMGLCDEAIRVAAANVGAPSLLLLWSDERARAMLASCVTTSRRPPRRRYLLARNSAHRRFNAVTFGFARGRLFFARVALRFTRSGSFCPPVSRFHSSYVSLEIFPSTSSWANFRR